MMERSKLASIRTLEELDAAIEINREETRRSGSDTLMDWRRARSFYTPATLLNHLMDKAAPAVSLASFAVDLYDRVRDAVSERRARRRAAQQSHRGAEDATTSGTCMDDHATSAPENESNL